MVSKMEEDFYDMIWIYEGKRSIKIKRGGGHMYFGKIMTKINRYDLSNGN